jgi:hypothetical protein
MASQGKLDVRPTAAEAHRLFEQTGKATPRPTLLPVCITVPSDLLTPSAIYLKLSNGCVSALFAHFETSWTANWLINSPQRHGRLLVPAGECDGKH